MPKRKRNANLRVKGKKGKYRKISVDNPNYNNDNIQVTEVGSNNNNINLIENSFVCDNENIIVSDDENDHKL